MYYSIPLSCLLSIISISILYFIYRVLIHTEYVKLHYESQNFGVVKAGTVLTLNDNNSAFHDFSDNDILAFQELLMPEGRWNERTKMGTVEQFKSKDDTRYGWFVAVSTASKTIDNNKYIKCFGLNINPNLNFKVTDIEDKLTNQKDSYNGSLIVSGRLYDTYNVAFVCVHLIWDKAHGYDNVENKRLIDDLFDYLCSLKLDYFVVLGDFNIRFSTFKNECIPRWKKIIPYFNTDVDNLKTSLITCYDADGFAHPDHIITNLKIDSFRTRLKYLTDHCNIYGTLLIPIPKFKTLTTAGAVNTKNPIPDKNK